MLEPRASFAVHHGPVGLAASPHALTSAAIACAACPSPVGDELRDGVGASRRPPPSASAAPAARPASDERRDGRDPHELSSAAARSTRGRRAASRARREARRPAALRCRRISRETPIRPSSASGWRTDVSRGVTITACSVSSKPTTERSSGTERPRSRAACSAPIATLSLKPKIAVGGSGSESSCACRLGAAWDPPVGVDDELGVEQDPGARERGAEAVEPLLGRVPAGRAGDRADPPVAELEQVLGRLLRARRVHRRDAGDTVGRRLARIDDDEGESLPLQRQQLLRRLLRQHQDRAVGGAAHQPLEQRHLAVVLVQRRREHDPHVALVQRLGRAAQHRPEVRVGDERQGQADHPGPAAREPAGAAVRREAVLAHDLQDGLAGLPRHVRPVVEDARDRRDRDAGQIGDVANRRAAAERLVGTDVSLCHQLAIQSPGSVSGNSREDFTASAHGSEARRFDTELRKRVNRSRKLP